MAETTENAVTEPAGWANAALVGVAGLLVLSGLVAFYALGSLPVWARWGLMVAGLAAGTGAFSVAPTGRLFWAFVSGSRVEVRKMVWPTKDDTWRTTFVVFIFVVVLALFFWLLDMVLGYATRHLLGTGV